MDRCSITSGEVYILWSYLDIIILFYFSFLHHFFKLYGLTVSLKTLTRYQLEEVLSALWMPGVYSWVPGIQGAVKPAYEPILYEQVYRKQDYLDWFYGWHLWNRTFEPMMCSRFRDGDGRFDSYSPSNSGNTIEMPSVIHTIPGVKSEKAITTAVAGRRS